RRRGERNARPGGGQRHRSPAPGDRQGVRLPLPGGRDGYRERDRDATALRAPSPDAGDRAVPPRGGNRAAAGRRRLGSRDPGRGPLAARPQRAVPRFRMIVLRPAGPPDYSAETGELTMVATEQAAAFRYATVFCRKRPLSLVREAGPPPPPRLLDRARAALRARHFSRRTEETYVAWIRRYIFFHDKRHPAEMGAPEVTRFLTSLAVDNHVASSTQNQALSALLFLYREVLEVDLPWLDGIVRARRPERLPVVLTRDEVRALLQRLEGAPRLMASLLYGAGLRVMECCRLRIQDVDFAANQIVVRG